MKNLSILELQEMNKITFGEKFKELPPSVHKFGVSLEHVCKSLHNMSEKKGVPDKMKQEIDDIVSEVAEMLHDLPELARAYNSAPGPFSSPGAEGEDGSEKVYRSFEEERERLKAAEEALEKEFIRQLEEIVESHLAEKVDIEYLTEKLYMSRSTLYRKVKSLTGMSANEFIRLIKMRKAKELMLSGNLTLSEIAYMVGCSSPGYFRESFKAVFGMVPSEYIRNLREK